MKKSDNSKFKKGRGVFKCAECGKQTRDAGDNNGTDLCPLCNAKAECGNTVSDNTSHPSPWAAFKDCQTVQECYDLCDRLVNNPEPAETSAAAIESATKIAAALNADVLEPVADPCSHPADVLSVPDRLLTAEETRELTAAVRSHFSASEILAIAFDRYVSSEPTLGFDDNGGDRVQPLRTRVSLASGKFQAEKDRLVSARMVQAANDDIAIAIGRILGCVKAYNDATAAVKERDAKHGRPATTNALDSSVTLTQNALVRELNAFGEFADPEKVADVLESLDEASTVGEPTLFEALTELAKVHRFGRIYNAIAGCQALPVNFRIEVRNAADRTQPRFTNSGAAIGIPTNDN